MYRRLLVPHDGSLLSERALSYAIPIAARHNASIVVVQVSGLARESAEGGRTSAASEEVRANLRRQMERTVRRLGRQGIPIEGEFRDGTRAVEGILSAAEEHGADLIVIATHGRGGLTRLWLGSTTDELLRSTTLPVLVVRKARSYTELRPSDPVFPRMVVALDGSPESERALAECIRLMANDDAHLILARVEDAILPGPTEDWVDEAKHRLTGTYLEPLAARYNAPGRQITTSVVAKPDIARALLDISRGERAYLIAVATHGRSGARRLVLGSVADKVIRGADIPVLVIPARS